MRVFLGGFLLLLIAANARDTDAPPGDLVSALRKPNEFHVRKSVADIPGAVRAAFAKAARVKEFSMAEPGAAWQATDVVMQAELPWRRLTAVAVSSTFCLVFYERGGIARTSNVAAFRLTKTGAEAVWHAYLPGGAEDPAGLRAAIDERRVVAGAGAY